MSGSVTKKLGSDYWAYSVGGAFQLTHAQFKPVINDHFISGLDVGLGLAKAGYSIDQTDEALAGQDVYRSGYKLAGLIPARLLI